jgi:hypothetical protein
VTTRLDRPLKREVLVKGEPYTVTLDADGISVVPKGKRKGRFLAWSAITSGDASLAEDLRVSLDATSREQSAGR